MVIPSRGSDHVSQLRASTSPLRKGSPRFLQYAWQIRDAKKLDHTIQTNLGYAEEAAIRTYTLQSLINVSYLKLHGHQADAFIILSKLAGAIFAILGAVPAACAPCSERWPRAKAKALLPVFATGKPKQTGAD